MELYYNVNIKMKDIDNAERYNELLEFLKNGNDVKIYNLKTEKDIISFHTENDNTIDENLNVGVSKFTKKYNNDIMRISTELENSVCYEPNHNFGYFYAKNGSIGLYYRSKYKPLYIPSGVKAQGITWIADKNNKLYVGKHMIEYLLKNQSEFDELNNKDEFLERDDTKFKIHKSWPDIAYTFQAHDIYLKKPIQFFYKVIDYDLEKVEHITKEEFMLYFDKENLKMFEKDFDFNDCADDVVTTFFEDAVDDEFIHNEPSEEDIENAKKQYNEIMKTKKEIWDEL